MPGSLLPGSPSATDSCDEFVASCEFLCASAGRLPETLWLKTTKCKSNTILLVFIFIVGQSEVVIAVNNVYTTVRLVSFVVSKLLCLNILSLHPLFQLLSILTLL